MEAIEILDPRPRTSVASILSLGFGILGCIPLVAGLAALTLGIVGIRKTREPMVTGRDTAIAGAVLGAFSLFVGELHAFSSTLRKTPGAWQVQSFELK